MTHFSQKNNILPGVPNEVIFGKTPLGLLLDSKEPKNIFVFILRQEFRLKTEICVIKLIKHFKYK